MAVDHSSIGAYSQDNLASLHGFECTTRNLAYRGLKDAYLSSGQKRAEIVIVNILNHSAKEVKMIAGAEFFSQSSNKMNAALENFILDKKKISILLEEKDLERSICSNIFKTLEQLSVFQSYKSNIDIRTTSEKSTINDHNCYYAIGDNKMYRKEYDIEKCHAKFCFNDKEVCQKLSNEFDKSFLNAKAFDLAMLSL